MRANEGMLNTLKSSIGITPPKTARDVRRLPLKADRQPVASYQIEEE